MRVPFPRCCSRPRCLIRSDCRLVEKDDDLPCVSWPKARLHIRTQLRKPLCSLRDPRVSSNRNASRTTFAWQTYTDLISRDLCHQLLELRSE